MAVLVMVQCWLVSVSLVVGGFELFLYVVLVFWLFDVVIAVCGFVFFSCGRSFLPFGVLMTLPQD